MYALYRLGYSVVVIFLASIVTFVGLRVAPGDVTNSVFNTSTTPPEVVEQFKKSIGLDKPLLVQYFDYLRRLVTGDFGQSLTSRLPVWDIVSNSAGYTLILAAVAFVFAFGLGIPLGMVAALRRGKVSDGIIRVVSSAFFAIPNFVLGIVLILILGVAFRLLPVSGADSWQTLIMPAIALGAEPCALTIRVTRTAILEQQGSEFTRTLRARGVSTRRINWIHLLRNSLTSIISLGAVQIRTLLGYTLLVEVIFRWPGLGYQLVQSILQRDYPVTQILAILLAVVVVISSALGDLALRWADPRVRVDTGAVS